MSWGDFLRYAAGPGIGVIVGVILSFLIEYIPPYCQLDSKGKRLVFFALCLCVPLLATLAAVATGEWGAWGDLRGTWWPALTSGVLAGGVGTLVHTRKLDGYRLG